MDSLTHIAIGACIGEAFFEKGFGKKAMWWGALAQSFPDIDFMGSLWLDIPGQLLAHRGFTHSVVFVCLIVPYFSLIAHKVHHPHPIKFRVWLFFFSVELFTHLILDSFNTYGIGWLEPFSHQRFAFHILFVADPFFSILPILAFIFLCLLHAHHTDRAIWWKLGLFTPIFYLMICFHNKSYIDRLTVSRLNKLKINYSEFHTTPAPLQNALWYVYIKSDSGCYVGYLNLFHQGKDLKLVYFTRNDYLLDEVSNHESLQQLIRFSQGFYTLTKTKFGVQFNDLRFGQTHGWDEPLSPFVMSYNLTHDTNSRLSIQHGRSMVFEAHHLWTLVQRMIGRS